MLMYIKMHKNMSFVNKNLKQRREDNKRVEFLHAFELESVSIQNKFYSKVLHVILIAIGGEMNL